METIIPSRESKIIADDIVDAMYRDKVFEQYENGYKINDVAVKARIAGAVELSWRQGLDDAEIARRVSLLRSNG